MKSIQDLLNGKGQRLYTKAKELIPGGTQLLSKRPEMFAPNLWPAYYSRSKGYKIWDLDNVEYDDMSIMGIGACVLGYADDYIDNAVIDAIKSGSASTLNSYEEVKLAEALIDLHPWLDQIRYTKSGGEAVSVAIRIARASTRREKVLFSGYHGWSDWYLAANLANDSSLDGQLMPGLEPLGIPRGLSGTSIPFDLYNFDELLALSSKNKKDIAAIIIEPARGDYPPLEILEKIRQLADRIGAVLIFDEITSGFRECTGGIHRNFDIKPDIAIFAKGLGNGYPIAAILGKSKVMKSAQDSFISSTNWTERTGLVAAIKTIEKFESFDVSSALKSNGKKIKDIWSDAAELNNLNIKISGLDSLPSFTFNSEESVEFSTVYCVEMLKRNMLGFRQFKPSFAHDAEIIKKYKKNTYEIFKIIKNQEYNLQEIIKAHSGFYRLVKE